MTPRTRCEKRTPARPICPRTPPAPKTRFFSHMGFKWPIQASLKEEKVSIYTITVPSLPHTTAVRRARFVTFPYCSWTAVAR